MRLALALACLTSPVVARAAVVSYSAPASGAAWGAGNTIPDFDPSFGVLERVQLRLTGTASDYVSGWYKRAPDYQGMDGYHGHHPNYTAAEYTAIPVVRVSSHGAELSGEAVTVIISDWGGSYSGGYSAPIDSVADLPPEAFGRSPNGRAEYTLTSDTILDHAASPWSSTSRPDFQGTATVTYTYGPLGVPEPGSLTLLAFGLAGCVAAGRRTAGVVASRRRPM